MKHAIQYALTYPDRRENCLEPLDFRQMSRLTFEEPDSDRFPCLDLAYKALKRGGTAPATLNAANEVAVAAFLDGKIRFTDIASVIESVLEKHQSRDAGSIESILSADDEARIAAHALVEGVRTAAPIGA
jgi:1-deoxy-D-xylulose-5-phosphate reductoisomerase